MLNPSRLLRNLKKALNLYAESHSGWHRPSVCQDYRREATSKLDEVIAELQKHVWKLRASKGSKTAASGRSRIANTNRAKQGSHLNARERGNVSKTRNSTHVQQRP